MDVLSHGLWGGALFGRKSPWQWRWTFLLGAAPDVIAFGPFMISQFGRRSWIEFPRYVYQTYDVTHSLVVWSAAAAAVWLLRKEFPWIFCAWGFHIVCDLPLHELNFFPTPYLWPLPTPLVNGVHWAQLPVLIPNYIALFTVYVFWLKRRRRNEKPGEVRS